MQTKSAAATTTTTAKKKKQKKSRYAVSRYAVTPLPVTPLRVLLTTLFAAQQQSPFNHVQTNIFEKHFKLNGILSNWIIL